MKRGYIVILIVLWALAFAKFIDKRDVEEADIVTAFSNDRFLSTNSHIKAVALYGNTYFSDDAKRDMLISVAGKLGIYDDFKFESSVNEEVISESLIKNSKYAVTEIKFVSVKNDRDAMVERQYIMVDISIANSLESAVVYRDKIENVFEDMELKADVTLTLKGNISGNLSIDEKDAITDDIIENLGAEIVTQRRASDIYTVYAYSEGIDDYVVNGTSKTNVNIAVSYNELMNETNIYMATPIIDEGY